MENTEKNFNLTMSDEAAIKESEQLFFNISDSTKIKTFLQIPKELFVNPIYKKLSLSCKLTYSIYLQRYSITTYKDEIGPYIIFSDKEVSQLIDCSVENVGNIRRKLQIAGLISFKRSVSYNKIYVYSYAKQNPEDKIFYYESDIEMWKFYRYPTEFFESKYDNLPLEAKFIYSIYFDTMCLSKANYFTDNKERIYFQESYIDQELKSNFSKNTLAKYRNYLKACNLLYEYQPFGQKIRFYLIKLDMYEDNVFIYEHLSDVDKSIFIQNKMNLIKENFIEVKQINDIQFIKRGIKTLKLTREAVTELIYEKTGKMLSVSGLKKYLNETRTMPDDIYNFLYDYIERNTPKVLQQKGPTVSQILQEQVSQKNNMQVSQIFGEEKVKNKESNMHNNTNTISQISLDEYLNDDLSINHTTNNKENNIKYTLLKECKNKINMIDILISEDKDFLNDTMEYLSSQEFIQTKKTVYEENDIIKLMQYFINDTKNIVIPLLNRLYGGGQTFYTAESVMKYFITMLINDYEVQQTNPGWFQSGNTFALDEYRSRIKERYPQMGKNFDSIPEDTKNFKWWEDEN